MRDPTPAEHETARKIAGPCCWDEGACRPGRRCYPCREAHAIAVALAAATEKAWRFARYYWTPTLHWAAKLAADQIADGIRLGMTVPDHLMEMRDRERAERERKLADA